MATNEKAVTYAVVAYAVGSNPHLCLNFFDCLEEKTIDQMAEPNRGSWLRPPGSCHRGRGPS